MLCGSRNPTEPTTQLLIRARERFPYNGGMALLSGKLRRGVARLNSRGHRRSAQIASHALIEPLKQVICAWLKSAAQSPRSANIGSLGGGRSSANALVLHADVATIAANGIASMCAAR